jgi:hypothetical protein
MDTTSAAYNLALVAARCGRLAHATRVFAESGQLQAQADEHGVDVTEVPRDLYFREHPRWDEHPRHILSLSREQMIEGTGELSFVEDTENTRVLAEIAADAIRRGRLTYLRVSLPETKTLYGNGANVTLTAPRKGRFFTRERTIFWAPLRELVAAPSA